MRRTILGLTAAVALVCTTTLARANEFPNDWFFGNEQQRARHNELVGKPAPELILDHWINTEPLTAKDVKGKIVVVDFWATWCGPCIRAIPKNNELHAKYKDKGVIILGVCGSQGQEKMPDVAKEHNVQYPMARDHTNQSAQAWRVMWWPTYGVIDRKGNLRALGLKPQHVEDVIKKLMEEEATAAADEDETATELVVANDIPAEWLEGSGDRRAKLNEMQGKDAPALELSNWINSDAVTLQDLKGKVVLLDFWATWCGPCIASIPKNNELARKYKDQGLVVLAVCHARGAEKMQQVVQERGIEYPTAVDAEGKTNAAYLVDSYPDYYLIDRNGKLRIADCKNGNVEDAIKLLLAESEVAAK